MANHNQQQDYSEIALNEMRQALARKFAAHAHSEGENPAINDLALYRHTAPSACYATTCVPSLSVFVQGRKLINLGGTEYLCDGSSFLVSSIEAPILSQIVEASKRRLSSGCASCLT